MILLLKLISIESANYQLSKWKTHSAWKFKLMITAMPFTKTIELNEFTDYPATEWVCIKMSS